MATCSSDRLGGSGGGGGSAVHLLRETSPIDRKIDEEVFQREQAIASLEGRLLADFKRLSHASHSSEEILLSQDKLERVERRLEERVHVLELARISQLEPVTQRLKELEILMETELQSTRDQSRVSLEKETQHRLQVSDTHAAELRRCQSAVETLSHRSKACETLEYNLSSEREAREIEQRSLRECMEYNLSAEHEAREIEQRSLRECMEELAEALKEKMAQFATDVEALDVSMREELDKVSGRAQRSALEALDLRFREEISKVSVEFRASTLAVRAAQDELTSSLPGSLRLLEDRLREEISCVSRDDQANHAALREAHRVSLSNLESRLADEISSRNHSQRSSDMESLREELRQVVSDHREGHDAHRSLLLEHREEIRRAHDHMHGLHRDSLETLKRQLREELESRHGQLDLTHQKHRQDLEALEVKLHTGLTASTHSAALEDCDARLREEIGLMATKHSEGHDALRGLLDEKMDEIRGVHNEKHSSLDMKFRDEIEQISSNHDLLRGLMAEHRDEVDNAHERRAAEQREALQALNDQVKEAEDRKRRQALQETESRLQQELAQIAAEHRQSHSGLRSMLAEHKDELYGQEDKRHSEHRQALRALEERLTQELGGGGRGRLDPAAKVAVDTIDARLNEEIARLSAEHRKAHTMLRDLLTDLKDGLGSYSRKHSDLKTAVDALDAKLMDELSSQGINGPMRSALSALEGEMKEELIRVAQGQQKNNSTLQDLLEEIRGEMDGHVSRLMAMHREALEDADARLEDIAKKAALESGGTTDCVSQTVLEDLMARFGGELESQRSRMEQQFMLQFRSMEEQLKSRTQNVKDAKGAAAPTNAAAIRAEVAKVSEDLALEDSEGRRWFFGSLHDFLQEVARRMKELQSSVEREQRLRDASVRSLELRAHDGRPQRAGEDPVQEKLGSGRGQRKVAPSAEQEGKLDTARVESQSKVNEIRQRYENGFGDSGMKARDEVLLAKEQSTEQDTPDKVTHTHSPHVREVALDPPTRARPGASKVTARYLQVPSSARDAAHGLSQSASTPSFRNATPQRQSRANSPHPSPAQSPQQQSRTLHSATASPQMKDRTIRNSPVQPARGGNQASGSIRARPGS